MLPKKYNVATQASIKLSLLVAVAIMQLLNLCPRTTPTKASISRIGNVIEYELRINFRACSAEKMFEKGKN